VNTAEDWIASPAQPLDLQTESAARARQDQLTKPPGALGELEAVAIHLAALQGRELPCVDRVQISVFAGDHGVAVENVSAFPQAVTLEMIANFARGGAAISVLARELQATLEVIDLGTVVDAGARPGVIHTRLGAGTANLAREAAMSDAQLDGALCAGRDAVLRAQAAGAELFIGGEMGIANTTAATALACALTGASPQSLAGPGTGLDRAGVNHKAEVIAHALKLHQPYLSNPREALRRLGGFEIAALAGAYIACAQLGIPALIDGFIASAAALAAQAINPSSRSAWLFAHASAEPGHARVLEALHAKPLLNLGLRLGEGSGAAVAVPLLRLACVLHANMATFAQAGVSEKSA